MTIAEIIALSTARIKALVGITVADVNDAVLFIAANSYLPDLLVDNVIVFGASDTATIIDVTNATPIVIETDASHPFLTGAYVKIADVVGNTAANASWFIQKLTATTFSLLGSTGNGAYASGGTAVERHTKEALSNFHHDIINPVNITIKEDINLRSSKRVLYDMYLLSERFYGNITDVAIEKETLYALPIPEADQIITFSCYDKPETIAGDDTVPTIIPPELHDALIVNKILMDKFPFIEKTERGKGPNMDLAINNFNTGMALLAQKYPSPARQKKTIQRKLHFF